MPLSRLSLNRVRVQDRSRHTPIGNLRKYPSPGKPSPKIWSGKQILQFLNRLLDEEKNVYYIKYIYQESVFQFSLGRHHSNLKEEASIFACDTGGGASGGKTQRAKCWGIITCVACGLIQNRQTTQVRGMASRLTCCGDFVLPGQLYDHLTSHPGRTVNKYLCVTKTWITTADTGQLGPMQTWNVKNWVCVASTDNINFSEFPLTYPLGIVNAQGNYFTPAS